MKEAKEKDEVVPQQLHGGAIERSKQWG